MTYNDRTSLATDAAELLTIIFASRGNVIYCPVLLMEVMMRKWFGHVCVAVVLGALTVGTPREVGAQAAQEITFQQLRQLFLNSSIELWRLNELAGEWPDLRNLMGTPTSETCEDVIVGEECTFTWPGVTADYTDITGDWELVQVVIEDGASLMYGGQSMGPGDSIQKLAGSFPDAYAARGSVNAFGEMGCSHNATISHVISSIVFCYDPVTSSIQRIVWWRYFT